MRTSLNIFFWFLFLSVISIVIVGALYFINNHYAPALVTLRESSSSGPREPIIIQFSKAMQPESFIGKITLSKNFPFESEWQEKNTVVMLTPKEDWPLGETFELSIQSGKTKYLTKSVPVAFSIKTKEKPTIKNISPRTESTGVVLDIEDPIKVSFNQPADDLYIDFRINDIPAVVNTINPERTLFEVLPETPLLPNTKHSLDIYAKWKNTDDSSSISIAHSTFTTAPLETKIESNLPNKNNINTKSPATAKRTEGKYIDIDLAHQTMTLFEDGRILDTYIVSSGKRGMETPTGEFRIHNKADRPWSKKYSLFMPYWMSFVSSGLFGIHELPEWPGGYKEGANHLGTPVSHGCVRLGVGPAQRVFEWADVGTPVIVY